MTKFFYQENHDSGKKQILTPTQKTIKCSKKQLDYAILPPKCAEHALSNLLMSPWTSPDEHSPVKPAPSIETEETIDESDSDIDNIKGLNSEAAMLFQDIN